MTIVSGVLPDWLNVSRETSEALLTLEQLVRKWTSAVNLISKASVTEIWERHILDSAQIWPLLKHTPALWVDLGSGGGFPALVLAVIARDHSPKTKFTLVESDARKAAFLMQAIRTLNLNGQVIVKRIESVDALGADVVSARALGSLDLLLGFAHRHIKPSGRAFFPKGSTFQQELSAAHKRWKFNCHTHISRTDPQAAILEVDGIELL